MVAYYIAIIAANELVNKRYHSFEMRCFEVAVSKANFPYKSVQAYWDSCFRMAGYQPVAFVWRGPGPQKKWVKIL